MANGHNSSPSSNGAPVCRLAARRSRCVLSCWEPTRALSPGGVERWVSGMRANTYSRGNVLFYQGNEPLGIFFVCSGAVRLVRGDGEGRHQVVRVVRGPELLGERALVAGQPYEASAEVVEEAVVCFMEGRRFSDIWNADPGLPRLIAKRLAERLGQAQETLAEMGLRTLRERLARLIARGHEAALGAPVSLGGSRQQLAEMLGTSPEVVCRALAELERRGLIALEGHGARVLNEHRLRALAGLPPRNGGPGR